MLIKISGKNCKFVFKIKILIKNLQVMGIILSRVIRRPFFPNQTKIQSNAISKNPTNLKSNQTFFQSNSNPTKLDSQIQPDFGTPNPTKLWLETSIRVEAQKF